MRIALFSGNYNYLREGANQALNMLVRHAEERAGCRVRVYSPVTDTPAFEPAGTLVPVPSVALPVRGEFRLALGLPKAIRADIAEFSPDIIHLSTPDILGVRAQAFARRLGVPVVASMHTRFETYLAYYRLGWARPLLDAHLARFYRRCDHVLAPTTALVDELRALRSDEAASVWSRGIDSHLFAPSRRDPSWRMSQNIAEDETVVLFFGRLVLEKGIDVYLGTMRELAARGRKVRPLVVGEGPARSLFADLSGSILTGHLDGEGLARVVASADIMLCPSTTETFGNVLVEAMASGLPVVSADAQNARSILTPGRDGLICPARDVAAYADAVESLVADPARRGAMAAAARQKSLSYSWEAASDSVISAWRRLAG